jgi:hypothetical protein
MKKLLLIVIIEILSCKSTEKQFPINGNEMPSPVQKISGEIRNENVYYLNAPGNMWLKAYPGDLRKGHFMFPVHKRKVTVLEEIEGWKKVQISAGNEYTWIEDRYFVKNLDEIMPDYDFIENAVGKYYLDKVEVIIQDFEDEIIMFYGNIIVLYYESGDTFYLRHGDIIENSEALHGNRYVYNVPNNDMDPFSIGGSDGKRSYFYEYYFIEKGIKIRIRLLNFNEDGDFIYDLIYLKE